MGVDREEAQAKVWLALVEILGDIRDELRLARIQREEATAAERKHHASMLEAERVRNWEPVTPEDSYARAKQSVIRYGVVMKERLAHVELPEGLGNQRFRFVEVALPHNGYGDGALTHRFEYDYAAQAWRTGNMHFADFRAFLTRCLSGHKARDVGGALHPEIQAAAILLLRVPDAGVDNEGT